MPWQAPTLRSTGDLITASIWNGDLVGNLNVLKTSLDNNGHLQYPTFQSVSANYSVQTTDDVIEVSSGSPTITLYTPVGNKGKQVIVKNLGTGAPVLATAAGNIDGQATQTLSNQYMSLTCLSDGTNWSLV